MSEENKNMGEKIDDETRYKIRNLCNTMIENLEKQFDLNSRENISTIISTLVMALTTTIGKYINEQDYESVTAEICKQMTNALKEARDGTEQN